MKQIFRSFFYSGGKFMPVYFYIFAIVMFAMAFLAAKLTIAFLVIKDAVTNGDLKSLGQTGVISDFLLTTLFGAVAAWVFSNNYDRKNQLEKGSYDKVNPPTTKKEEKPERGKGEDEYSRIGE